MSVRTPQASLVSDTVFLAGRHIRLMSRRPASIISALLMPLIFAVLFFSVLGTAMERTGVDYIQYLVPAIVMQAMFFTAMSASIWAAEDASGGMINRLRVMPISRAAPVLSLLGGELTRAVVSITVVVGAGYLVGFRFENGIIAAGGFVLLALGFAAAGCAAYLVMGFAVAKVETVGLMSGLIYYPLLLVSNLLVPAPLFPNWLQPIVENQPFSRVADALRATSTDASPDTFPAVAIAVAWIVGLILLFGMLAPRAVGKKQ